jgi:hypothetical protein
LATLTIGSGLGGTSYNGSSAVTITNSSPMTYPSAGIGNSTGSAWGTSYTTSGSGTVIALNNTPSLTNPTVTNYVETLYSVTGSAILALTNGTVQKVTTSSSTMITLPASVSGKSFTVIVYYASTDAITWAGGTTLKWAGGTTPTATSATGKYDIFNFYQDGTSTFGSIFGQNY